MGGGQSVVPIVRPALDDLDHVVFNAVDDAVGVVDPAAPIGGATGGAVHEVPCDDQSLDG